jgi:hypothetical protein
MALPIDSVYAGTNVRIADVQAKYNDCLTLFPDIQTQLSIVSSNVASMYNDSINLISTEINSLLEQYGINCASRAYFGQDADDLITDKYDIYKKMQAGDIYNPINDQLDDMLAQTGPFDCSISAVEDFVRGLFDNLTSITDGRSSLMVSVNDIISSMQSFFDDVNRALSFLGEWLGCGEQMFSNFYDLGPAMDTYNTYANDTFTAIDNAKQVTDNPKQIFDMSVEETKSSLGLQTRMDDLRSEASSILTLF